MQQATTAADGTYSVNAPIGAPVVLSAFPLPGSGDVASSTEPLTVTAAGIHDETIALDGTAPLPAGLRVNGTSAPTVFWASPSAARLTGCPGGSAFVTVEGMNTATGQRAAQVIPLAETPAGSGTYTGTIPPLEPVHGPVNIGDQIFCPSASPGSVLPSDGTAGTAVLISGTSFTGANAVAFGGAGAASFTVVSDSLIEAVAPPGEGDVAVTVQTPASSAHTVGTFGYFSVTAMSPSSGPPAGNTTVDIRGGGFSGTTGVTFGTTEALSFNVISDTEVQAVAPPGSGTVDVHVLGADDSTADVPADRFTYSTGSSALGAAVVRARSVTGPAPLPAMEAAAGAASGSGLDVSSIVNSTLASLGGQIQSQAQALANSAVSLIPPNLACSGPVDKARLKEIIHALLLGGIAVAVRSIVAAAAVNLGATLTLIALLALGPVAAIVVASIIIAATALLSLLVAAELNALLDVYLDPLIDNAIAAKCGGSQVPPPPPSNGYIDPNGTALDTAGVPVRDATVTILRADTAAGPFMPVSTAGPGIQPAVNPETTGADGVFDWDVFSGWYEIQGRSSPSWALASRRRAR